MTARGGFGPLFFCSSACCGCDGDGTQDIAPFGAPVGVAVKKWWRGRLPPAAPCGGGALAGAPPAPRYWILRRPRRPTAGRACAPPCRGSAACSRGGGSDSMGGGAAAARPLWGVPLSPAGAVVPAGCGGGGCCRGGAGGWAVPLRFTQSPRRRPAPSPRPLAPAGAGWGVPLAAASGDEITHLPRIFHINVVNDIERQQTICRIRGRVLTKNHKKLENLGVLSQETCNPHATTGGRLHYERGDPVHDLTRQERWHKRHLRTVSSKLTIQQYQRFLGICQLCGLTPYAAIRLFCKGVTVEFLDNFMRNSL